MKNRFSAMAFITIEPIMRAIRSHPFIVELIDGVLSRERFLFYMRQDSLYLAEYAKALSLTAGKMRLDNDVALVLHFAEQALLAERELHEYFFVEYQVTPGADKSPACFAYCSHLLERAALGTPAESVAALLPCFWIYREAGNHVRRMADSDNPWYKWIESYSSEAYSILVDKAVDLTDRLAANVGEEERQSMLDGFIASSRYEYGFWDDAYAMRVWPQ